MSLSQKELQQLDKTYSQIKQASDDELYAMLSAASNDFRPQLIAEINRRLSKPHTLTLVLGVIGTTVSALAFVVAVLAYWKPRAASTAPTSDILQESEQEIPKAPPQKTTAPSH